MLAQLNMDSGLIADSGMATTGGVMVMIGFSLGFILLAAFLTILVVMWFCLFIDCIAYEPSHGSEKALWIVLFLVVGVPVAPFYLLIRRPQRIIMYGR